MSTSWEYGDVSPARYPDFESKRKGRGAASSANHGGKKKKESKKKETVSPSSSSPTEVAGAIQQMVPVGLDAFAKDTVVVEQKDPMVLLEEYRQGKVTDDEVTVLQEGVSAPPPTQDQETQTALQELIDELVEAPPPPALPDYLICPYHICHLENRVSQNGWHYAKCPMFPCMLFCAEEKAPTYMRAVHEQVHSDILKMWKHLLCFCCKPPTVVSVLFQEEMPVLSVGEFSLDPSVQGLAGAGNERIPRVPSHHPYPRCRRLPASRRGHRGIPPGCGALGEKDLGRGGFGKTVGRIFEDQGSKTRD